MMLGERLSPRNSTSRYLIRDQPFRFTQHLFFMRRGIEQNQSVGCRHGAQAAVVGMHDPVDAKNVLVFDVGGVFEAGIENVQPAIEVSSPEPSGAIHVQGRDVAVREHCTGHVQRFSEIAAFGGLLVEAATRERIGLAIQCPADAPRREAPIARLTLRMRGVWQRAGL